MLMDKMCYTCLNKQSTDLIDLQKTDIDKISYKEKLSSCLPNLEEVELMKMCRSCIKLLRISYDFMKMVRKSQETIKESFSNENTTHSNELDKNNSIENESDGKENNRVGYIERHVDIKDELYESDNSDYFLLDMKTNDSEDLFTTCSKCGVHTNTEHLCNDELGCNELTDSKMKVEEDEELKITKKVKNKESVVYNCQQCEQTFTKRWQLSKHIARVHGKEKKFVCSFCHRAFKEAYHLREHITKHTGERNYSCSICGKTFMRASSQRRHLKAHEAPPGQKTKRTPFLCTICGKSFPFSNGVQRHMRIHLGIKKHECHICKRRFTQSTHLYVHMRTHTGEKPYICDICGDAFSLNVTLQKHMSIHQSKVKVAVHQGALTVHNVS